MATEPARRRRPVEPKKTRTPVAASGSALSSPPWHLTRFIGRQREIAEIRRSLAECRLLTLAGPGGCGKTRLAFEVAASITQMHDGVCAVELAGLTDASLVTQEIGASLGLQEQPGQPLIRSLLTHLRTKELLLVLDNCEHLIQTVAQIADTILRNCPNLRVLVTSREPLNLSGELVWRVPGMSVPDIARPMPIEVLHASDAVALFVDRARLCLPRFSFDTESGRTIARICVRLDGIPLAIELAAALVKVLTVEQILERLEQRFQLLTGGSPAALARHRTLRATVDWSYGFLNAHERMAFHRLSVCAGSFDLDAAEAISSAAGGMPTLELLSGLVDKSMVLTERGNRHAVRYRLLESLREYGKEKLSAAGELEAIRRRHALHYLDLAEQAEPFLTGAEQRIWMARLDLDYDNLRTALGWSQKAAPEIGLRLAAALTRFWLMRGLWSEGRNWLLGSLKELAGDVPLRAKGLLGAGTLAEAHGEYTEAGDLLERSAAAYMKVGDQVGVARALIQHGRVDYYQGKLELSQSHLERGLAYARRSADRWTEALALTELGHVAWRRGEYADARGLAQQGLEMFREIQDLWNVNFSGDYLGHVAHSLKQYSKARRHFEESLAISKELNDLWGVAHSLANLGDLSLDEQQQTAAEAYLVEALERMQEVGRPSAITAILEGFASLAAAQGEPQRAITLEAAAARVREELGFAWRLDLRTRVDGWLPSANESVGPAVVAKAERKGRAMNLESAVAYALEAVAARSGLKPPYEAHDAQPVLTRREVDIASLIAKGLSNRRIAERLFISQRTAETHVDRILTKLDFHSRAQIAVWAAQHGLLQNADPAAR